MEWLRSLYEYATDPAPPLNVERGADSLTVSTLNKCLEGIQAFQARYDKERAIADENQKKEQAYNNALAAWSAAHNQQLAAREQGRRAPNGQMWVGGQLRACNTL